MTNKDYIIKNKNAYQVLDAVSGGAKDLSQVLWHIKACFSKEMQEQIALENFEILLEKGLIVRADDGALVATDEGKKIAFNIWKIENEKKEELMRKKREDAEIKKLRKLTRDELNEALAALKKLRNEEPYSGELPTHNAMCYSTSMPTHYEWDKIPMQIVCATCGKKFGDKKAVAKHSRDYDKETLYIDKWDYRSFVRIFRELDALCYQAKMDFNCTECVKNKNIPLVLYHVKMQEDSQAKTSSPSINSKKGFEIWQYNKVTDCLTNIIGKAWLINYSKKEQDEYKNLDVGGKIKFWLEEVRGSIGDHEGEEWNKIYDAIEGILGVKIGGKT
ncbi:MAG: hypothetical protein FWE03_01290 [Firmicutes bacterium]|nr:hypothetical protein [Bacillota bacterium]